MSRMQQVRIVIADEHPIFRDGLRRLLETEPALRIVGETGNGSEAVALVHSHSADILLLGLSSTGRSSLDALQRMAASGSSARTILLTRSLDAPEVMNALRLGVYGVVPKDSAAEILFRSIDSVMEGHYWVGRERVSNPATSVRQLDTAQRRAKAFGLTRRELQIVRAVMSGHSNKEIARRSSISENTVKRHLTHIFNKVGASNRVELALFAAHHQLLDG